LPCSASITPISSAQTLGSCSVLTPSAAPVRARVAATDLVTAALGGVLSLSGLARAVNRGATSRSTSQLLAASVAGRGASRARHRAGQHVDLSMHEAVAPTIEQLFFQYWFDDVQPYAKSHRARFAALDLARTSWYRQTGC